MSWIVLENIVMVPLPKDDTVFETELSEWHDLQLFQRQSSTI